MQPDPASPPKSKLKPLPNWQPREFPNRKFWILTGAAGLVLFLAAAIYFVRPEAWLYRFETRVTYYWLAVVVSLMVYFLGRCLPSLREMFRELLFRGRHRWGLAALLLVVSTIAFQQIDPVVRMASDEEMQVGSAQSMLHWQRSELCDGGHYLNGRLECKVFSQESRPKTYPFLVSLVYAVFGIHDTIPHAVSFFFFLVAGLSLLRIAFSLGLSPTWCFLATALWWLWPVNLFWARSSGYEMTCAGLTSFAAMLALYLFQNLELPRERAGPLFFLLILSSALAMQTRSETIVVLSPMLVPLCFRWLRQKKWELPAGALLLTFSIAPLIALASLLRTSDHQAPVGQKPFELAHLVHHLPDNLKILSDFSGDYPFFPVFSILGFVALVAMLVWNPKGQRGPKIMVALWFTVALAMISTFFAGEFRVSVSLRYAIPLGAPLVLGAVWLLANLEEHFSLKFLKTLFCAILAFSFLQKADLLANNIPFSRIYLPQEDTLLTAAVQEMDSSSVFFYSRPSHLINRHHSAFFYESLLKPDAELLTFLRGRAGENIYYVKGLDCWEQNKPHYRELSRFDECEAVERQFELTPVFKRKVNEAYDLEIFKLGMPRALHP